MLNIYADKLFIFVKTSFLLIYFLYMTGAKFIWNRIYVCSPTFILFSFLFYK